MGTGACMLATRSFPDLSIENKYSTITLVRKTWSCNKICLLKALSRRLENAVNDVKLLKNLAVYNSWTRRGQHS